MSDRGLALTSIDVLDKRVRQIVILTVGAVWKTDYGLYFHQAVAVA